MVAALALLAAPGGVAPAEAGVSTPVQLVTPIRHVVVIFQENQSFDSVLGGFCGARPGRCDGSSQGLLPDGTPIALAPLPDLIPDIAHDVASQRTAIDGGKMDGFAKVNGCRASGNTQPGSIPYGCFSQATSGEVDNLWKLAQAFALSDRTFELARSPSWGGHLEVAAGTTDRFLGNNPHFTNPAHIPGLVEGPDWGCDSNKDTQWVDPATGKQSLQPSCIPARDGSGPYRPSRARFVPTIMDRLDAAGLPWRLYTPTVLGTTWSVCPSFAECQFGPQKLDQIPNTQFAVDAAAGNLPALSIVIPEAPDSQHNGYSMTQGDNWIVSTVNAVAANRTEWDSTAFFITYDDCGCFYDHVPPPGPTFGIRVPMVIVSAYAKEAYTDSKVASYASMLAFTEHVFGLAPLGNADKNAYDFTSSFDFTMAPRPPITLTRTEVPAWERAWIAAHPTVDDPT